MPISLNHTIVAAADNERAARFFATVMGLHYTGYTGPERHFAPVRINEYLTLDFMTVPEPPGSHLARGISFGGATVGRRAQRGGTGRR
jgi:hypothetical protein